jgi:hypothetical protein
MGIYDRTCLNLSSYFSMTYLVCNCDADPREGDIVETNKYYIIRGIGHATIEAVL